MKASKREARPSRFFLSISLSTDSTVDSHQKKLFLLLATQKKNTTKPFSFSLSTTMKLLTAVVVALCAVSAAGECVWKREGWY